MNLSTIDRQFDQVFGTVPTPKVPTTKTLAGVEIPRDPQDIARDEWVARELPNVVAALRSNDYALGHAFGDVRANRALLTAFRENDAIEFFRLFENAVDQALASTAETALEREAFEKFPEDA